MTRSILEQAAYSQQQMMYGAVLASSLNRVAPPSTTTAFIIFINNTWAFWSNFFTKTIPGMFKPPLTPIKFIVRLILIFLLVMVVIYIINTIKNISNPVIKPEGFEDKKKTNIQPILNSVEKRVNDLMNVTTNEGFQVNIKNKLINIQPMTVKQAAFLGPLKNGAFDANNGISQQLKLGVRSFFFNIDYITEQKDVLNQPLPYEPVLIYRDNDKNLTSYKSYATLEETFKYLGEYAFNDRIPNYTSPVIVYLHFVRTPDKLNQTERYVQYIKKVSTSLNILNPFLAKDYYRSSKESDLFNQDISVFDKKILIGTNIDTSYSKQLNAENRLTLMEDLDFKINFHYYKEDKDSIDATVTYGPQTVPNAFIVKAMTLLNMSEQERNDWLEKHKNKFILVKDEPMNILYPAQVGILLNTFGVNVVPYDFFNSELKDAKNVKKQYNGSSKVKPDILLM
jgi:hypothetical protein